MLSVLPSLVVLGAAAIAALLITHRRPSPDENKRERLAASQGLALATGIQCVHFLEEAVTGFHEKFPALLGFPEMSFFLFVAFNLVWLAIWGFSIPGIRSARPIAFFAAWFLTIAGLMNGVGHPLLAIAVGGYFPGLFTSPFIGLVCVWLLFKLRGATQLKLSVNGC